MTEFPPPGNFPPPPPGGYPPPPPGGGYPPPPGGYPSPPPGGYPPPPPGWGYPPPPGGGYPGWGYPPPPGARPSFSVGEGFSWAWNKFTKNAGPLVVATLVFGLILGVLGSLNGPLLQAVSPESFDTTDAAGFGSSPDLNGTGVAVLVLSSLLLSAVGGVLASAWYAGLLDIADGRPVSIGSFFRPRNTVSVVVAAIIVGILTQIGTALCILPGLIVAIFAMFTSVSTVDRNLSPIDGIKTSFGIVKANFGSALLVWLTSLAIVIVGALLCVVGLLAAAPVSYLLLVYAYRRLSGGSVVPATT